MVLNLAHTGLYGPRADAAAVVELARSLSDAFSGDPATGTPSAPAIAAVGLANAYRAGGPDLRAEVIPAFLDQLGGLDVDELLDLVRRLPADATDLHAPVWHRIAAEVLRAQAHRATGPSVLYPALGVRYGDPDRLVVRPHAGRPKSVDAVRSVTHL